MTIDLLEFFSPPPARGSRNGSSLCAGKSLNDSAVLLIEKNRIDDFSRIAATSPNVSRRHLTLASSKLCVARCRSAQRGMNCTDQPLPQSQNLYRNCRLTSRPKIGRANSKLLA